MAYGADLIALVVIDSLNVVLLSVVGGLLLFGKIKMEPIRKVLLFNLAFVENVQSIYQVVGRIAVILNNRSIYFVVVHVSKVWSFNVYIQMTLIIVDRFLLIFLNIRYPVFATKKRFIVLCVGTDVCIACLSIVNWLWPFTEADKGIRAYIYIGFDIVFVALFVATYSYVFYIFYKKKGSYRLTMGTFVAQGRLKATPAGTPPLIHSRQNINIAASDGTPKTQSKQNISTPIIGTDPQQRMELVSQQQGPGSSCSAAERGDQITGAACKVSPNNGTRENHNDTTNASTRLLDNEDSAVVKAPGRRQKRTSFLPQVLKTRFTLIGVICITFIVFNVLSDILWKLDTSRFALTASFLRSLGFTSDALTYCLLEPSIRRHIYAKVCKRCCRT